MLCAVVFKSLMSVEFVVSSWLETITLISDTVVYQVTLT